MKVEYNDKENALTLGKIQVRWSLDTSKIDIGWGLCPHIR